MTPPYTVVAQIVDKPAPGANTDILAEDFTLPHEGLQDVQINIALQNAGKVNLIMKPGPTLLGVKATGSIQAIAGEDLADADEFAIDDGVNDPVVFEFDDDDSVTESDTLRQLTFAGDETVAEIATLIAEAINAAPALDVTATVDPEDDTVVLLEHDTPGSFGNVAVTEDVTDAGFTVEGLSGGYGGDVVATLDINGAANLAVEALYQKTFRLQSGYLYNLQLTVDGIIRALSVSATK